MDNYFESPFRGITLDQQVTNPNIVVGRYSYYSGYYHGHGFDDCARYLDRHRGGHHARHPDRRRRGETADIVVDKRRLFLCHYPMITWPGARHQGLQLFGHVHQNWRGSRNSVNVGVDGWNFRPITRSTAAFLGAVAQIIWRPLFPFRRTPLRDMKAPRVGRLLNLRQPA